MHSLSAAIEAEARIKLDDLVRRSIVPGIQYLIVGSNGTLFDSAAGWSDLEQQKPMTPTTTLMAYSMSKSITAAAVLRLVESGHINLDDAIDTFLPWHPYGPGISLRQLLTHTSGIPNPIPLRWVHPSAMHETFAEPAALRGVLHEHPKPVARPGERYCYSNIGYWLLGPIVERVSGEPFSTYVNERIFRPLKIPAEELSYGIPSDDDHARGYLEKYSLLNLAKRLFVDRELIGKYSGRWLHLREHFVNGAAFGGLVGTARGFGKFLQDQLQPHSVLFGDATRRLFYQSQRLPNGQTIAMTPGWHIGAHEAMRFYYKEGGGGGFHCMMRVYPDTALASVVMTNATGFNVRNLQNRIDGRFLQDS